MQINMHDEAETGLKLLQAVSVFCFSFISQCATGLKFTQSREQAVRTLDSDI